MKGENFFEFCKPVVLIIVEPWNKSKQLISKLFFERDREKLISNTIPWGMENENGEKFEFNFEEKDPDTIEKLMKVFEKNAKQVNPSPSPKTPNIIEEDDPFYKKWWFIVLIIVAAIIIALGITFIFRRSIFRTKEKRLRK